VSIAELGPSSQGATQDLASNGDLRLTMTNRSRLTPPDSPMALHGVLAHLTRAFDVLYGMESLAAHAMREYTSFLMAQPAVLSMQGIFLLDWRIRRHASTHGLLPWPVPPVLTLSLVPLYIHQGASTGLACLACGATTHGYLKCPLIESAHISLGRDGGDSRAISSSSSSSSSSARKRSPPRGKKSICFTWNFVRNGCDRECRFDRPHRCVNCDEDTHTAMDCPRPTSDACKATRREFEAKRAQKASTKGTGKRAPSPRRTQRGR